MSGYVGKILRIDLTTHTIATLPTAKYARWGGGHGMGSAIFYELVKDKTIDGFHPDNVVTVMTSPISGTLVPAASGRTEVQGIGVQSVPEWFTRSNFGGRFGTMLKHAGWDGIVIQGRSPKPVWIDIRNDAVVIREADGLWGLDTWKVQQEIWRQVGSGDNANEWTAIGDEDEGCRSTQRPAVLTIGPAGENLCRVACLVHDAGNGAGQGGFGAVWGAKNLKAISVIGSGSIPIADPKALMEARLWSRKFFAADVADPQKAERASIKENPVAWSFDSPPLPVLFWKREKQSRPQACSGCHSGCRSRTGSGKANESSCAETVFYSVYAANKHNGPLMRTALNLLNKFGQNALADYINMTMGNHSSAYTATDLLQQYGINAYDIKIGIPYIRALNKMGILGPGKQIDCDLDFDRLGELDFIEKLLKMIALRQGAGDDMAEGFYRAAQRWGRLDTDLATGLLACPYWGLPEHGYDPRAELEWGYGSILGDRDINEHDFNWLFWMPTIAKLKREDPPISAEAVARLFAEKMKPMDPDPRMIDFSSENMYSEHIAKLVSWHRHYTRFWKQSVMYCDMRYANFYNKYTPDNRGISGEGEPRFFNAVTGANFNFVDGMTLGRKIWNLDHAIWTLQGRHREMAQFAPYIYQKPLEMEHFGPKYFMPGIKDGAWDYIDVAGRHIDRTGFEAWKTRYYRLEGWESRTGYPKRSTLASLGMGHVADELARNKRIGKG